MVTAHELFHHIQYAFGYKDDPGNEIVTWSNFLIHPS